MSTDRPTPEEVIAFAQARGIPARDVVAQLDLLLVGQLVDTNYQFSLYLSRLCAVAEGNAEPLPVADDLLVASCLSVAAEALRSRAKRREAQSAFDHSTDGEPR